MSHQHAYKKLSDVAVFCSGCGDVKSAETAGVCLLPHYPTYYPFYPAPYVRPWSPTVYPWQSPTFTWRADLQSQSAIIDNNSTFTAIASGTKPT